MTIDQKTFFLLTVLNCTAPRLAFRCPAPPRRPSKDVQSIAPLRFRCEYISIEFLARSFANLLHSFAFLTMDLADYGLEGIEVRID